MSLPAWPSRIAGVLLVFAVAIAVASEPPDHAVAQTNQVQVTAVSTDRWPAIEATVTIVDQAGAPIAGLPKEAFAATVGGQSAPVSNLNTTSDPTMGVGVVLAFDVSGSMAGVPMESARAAGKLLVSRLGAGDQAAILAFSDGPTVVQPFTADTATLVAAIDGLQAGGNTALFAGVEESVRLAASAPVPRRAIVLLSDGANFGSAVTDPAASLAAVQQSSSMVLSVGLGDAIDSNYLAQLASVGRGQFRVAPVPEDLASLYEVASDVLRQQYVVTLDATGLTTASPNETLRISVASGGLQSVAESALAIPLSAVATPVIPVTTPVPAAEAAAPVPAVAADESSSSSFPAFILAPVFLVFVAALGGFVVLRRRQRPALLTAETQALDRIQRTNESVAFPVIERAAANGSHAWLELPGGERVPLSDHPLTLGFGADCGVVLPNGTHAGTERARIWRRDGNFMLHNLSRSGGVSIAGSPVTWAVLEDGDELDIGSCRVLFRDESATAPREI